MSFASINHLLILLPSLTPFLQPSNFPGSNHLDLIADIMSSFGAKTIFAVDVGSAIETNLTNYGDWISGWWVLYHNFFGSSTQPVRVPSIIEIQSRLAYVSCVKHLEEVKNSGICHYIRPPIDPYMTLQFQLFEEILVSFPYLNFAIKFNLICMSHCTTYVFIY
ncbi:Neuropathy target esterase [Cichlidogyrus casuarinus]|uniref:Neuropathy target esterase n=1 Tax=Cichlidogyrus casuarinus TaxID=1844966 RepID=A0ABD2PPC7_9PLAT